MSFSWGYSSAPYFSSTVLPYNAAYSPAFGNIQYSFGGLNTFPFYSTPTVTAGGSTLLPQFGNWFPFQTAPIQAATTAVPYTTALPSVSYLASNYVPPVGVPNPAPPAPEAPRVAPTLKALPSTGPQAPTLSVLLDNPQFEVVARSSDPKTAARLNDILRSLKGNDPQALLTRGTEIVHQFRDLRDAYSR